MLPSSRALKTNKKFKVKCTFCLPIQAFKVRMRSSRHMFNQKKMWITILDYTNENVYNLTMNSLGITSLSFRQALNYTIACGLHQNHYINTWISQYYQSLSNECNISDCPAMWVHWLKKIDVVTPCWTYFVVIFLKPHTSCVICVDT